MYFLFSGSDYYPKGGAGDFVGAFSTLDEARAAVRNNKIDLSRYWAQIARFDGKMLEIIWAEGGIYDGRQR